ncbi:hypothetical protein SLEP1_g17926 [Rubroshorea leprosula]|uniref:Uncharacterized protein n=1 Tax=Rubroshorea leprosula TaxID=152421 RepID=A0AAV5IZG0_9ROSI|nr:hypothetical protein SLEP1_g17926 [Rubroshorea leprosula]
MMNQGIDILPPASYFQNSCWLYQEGKGTKWTPEENKQFENALAIFDKPTPDRWFKVAAMIPGKTVGDVIKQYKELEEDIDDIEAGLFPIHRYCSDSFTLEWVNNSQGFDGSRQYYSACGKRGTGNRHPDHERKKGVPWTEEEHRQFLMGLKKYGKGDWRNISRNFVTTRTPTQVASHAQKYFIRQLTGGKDKRRSSIHDITTVNVPDSISPPENNSPTSPNHAASTMKPQQQPKVAAGVGKELDWKQSYKGVGMVFNPTNGGTFMAPLCGISSYGPKLEEQDLLGVTLPGSQFVSYSPFLQMQSMQHQ